MKIPATGAAGFIDTHNTELQTLAHAPGPNGIPARYPTNRRGCNHRVRPTTLLPALEEAPGKETLLTMLPLLPGDAYRLDAAPGEPASAFGVLPTPMPFEDIRLAAV